jgi:hydroxymethylglutaryl-CoA lyase
MGEHTMQSRPGRILVTEVVTRDGFQDETRIIRTDEKVRVIEGVLRAGVRSIEVTSFVHPRVVPQMSDAEEVMARIPRVPGVTYSALAPNLIGATRAIAARVHEVRLFVSASESHNRANVNRSVSESLSELREAAGTVRSASPRVGLAFGIATAFGCPFEGQVPIDRVCWVIDQIVGMGVEIIGLADTTGMANPAQVERTVATVKERFPRVEFGLHFHNTRGLGLANAYAGLQAGVWRFDASLGGVGGCPFAPGATGNISTEDLVHMLHEMGIETGINLDVLIDEGRRLRDVVDHELESHVVKAGKSSDLHSLDEVNLARSRDG